MRAWIVAGWLATALVFGCSEEATHAHAPGARAPSVKTAPSSTAAQPASASTAPIPRPRPLPSFEGWTLDGKRFRVSSLLGRRGVLFFFNPEVPQSQDAATAVAHVAKLSREHNFQLVGIALATDPETAAGFAKDNGLDFPIVNDSAGKIAGRVGLPVPTAIVGVDAEGNVSFALAGLPKEGPDRAAVIEANLRDALRLPPLDQGAVPTLGERPRAPTFRAERIDGGDPLALASLRGRSVVLIFFLHTCPHCHKALEFFRAELAKIPETHRPALVGVSVSNRTYVVREKLRESGLDFFPVVSDPDYSIRTAYGVVAGVPDIFLIDSEGFVVARNQGWREDRDPALMRMRLAKLAGLPVPMLLHATGYSGNDTCAVCHEAENETWLLTRHAGAFGTLVRHGAERDKECVGCHVVGYEKEGGYASDRPTPYLENVGCETCHGRGGPHLSPGLIADGNYEAACIACHDQKHSLGFEYAKFLPRISHKANAQLAHLSLEEKQKLLAQRGRPRTDLLPATAEYVGSDACQDCHRAEYETWSKSKHESALDSLERKHATAQAECLACHTTAYGRPGGFPKQGRPIDHPDLARVGCESCHGPGGAHVKEGAARIGSIVSLGDKCDSCVILQICGTCHDDANDPGFEFAVQEKIDSQRHGTLEPGTGKPKSRAASGDASGRAPAAAGERSSAPSLNPS